MSRYFGTHSLGNLPAAARVTTPSLNTTGSYSANSDAMELACRLHYQQPDNPRENHMLRLTLKPNGPRRAAIRAEGRLVGEWVGLLAAECDRLLGEGRAIDLDLRGVADIDAEGLAVLRRLRTGSVTLNGCTPILLSALAEENAS